MKGDHDPVLLRPGERKIEAVKGAGAVKEHQRLSFAGRELDDLDAVDSKLLALQCRGCHQRTSWSAGWAARRPSVGAAAGLSFLRRGMTSSAKSVRFFTAFQCGMLPRWRWRTTRLELASSTQCAIASATRSGVPRTTRNWLAIMSQSNLPWSAVAVMRFRSWSVVR